MKNTKGRMRRFISNAPNHIYQRSKGGQIVFYTYIDHLAFYTITSVLSRKYQVTVLAECEMWNHYHMTSASSLSKDTSLFQCRCESQYVKSFNYTYKRKGSLFPRRFGSAIKSNDKELRTNIAYVCNNPVEKQLCTKAEDYRWNYLAYSNSKNSFSEEIVSKKMSKKLKISINIVDRLRSEEKPLYHHTLLNLFKGLSEKETNQLIDYIINKYSFIRYDLSIKRIGSYERFCMVLNSITAREYDIKEDWDSSSDIPYTSLTLSFQEKYGLDFPAKIFAMTDDKKNTLGNYILSQTTQIKPINIKRFLHIER